MPLALANQYVTYRTFFIKYTGISRMDTDSTIVADGHFQRRVTLDPSFAYLFKTVVNIWAVYLPK